MSIDETTIRENDQVILQKGKNFKVIQIRKKREIWMEKIRFVMDAAIGQPYGSSFEVHNKILVKVTNQTDDETEKSDEIKEDNRNLKDTTENQKLSKTDIQNMKKEGVVGQEIIEKIVENSATFKMKTEYSQHKYINKKKKRHLPVFTVLRPTTRLLAEMYYNKGPARICHLRMDSLSQLLLQSNVRASCKVMVVETCIGLIVGAVMERMAGQGTLIHFYGGTHPVKQALEAYNFPQSYQEILHAFPLNQVCSLKDNSVSSKGSRDQTVQSTEASSSVTSEASPEVLKASSSVMPEAVPDSKGGSLSANPEVLKAEEAKDQSFNKNADMTEANPDSKGESLSANPEVLKALKVEDESSDKDVDMTEEKTQCDTASENMQMKGEKRKHTGEEEKQIRKEHREKQIETTRQLILKADMDGLIVVSKYHPTPIVMNLLDFVAPSRPIVVFSPTREPLIDCYGKMRDRGGVVNLHLTETWMREHQVLPGRTHPQINMDSASGYLLFGTTVVA